MHKRKKKKKHCQYSQPRCQWPAHDGLQLVQHFRQVAIQLHPDSQSSKLITGPYSTAVGWRRQQSIWSMMNRSISCGRTSTKWPKLASNADNTKSADTWSTSAEKQMANLTACYCLGDIPKGTAASTLSAITCGYASKSMKNFWAVLSTRTAEATTGVSRTGAGDSERRYLCPLSAERPPQRRSSPARSQ